MNTKARKTHKNVARVTRGSANVFATLTFPIPEQKLIEALLNLPTNTILKDSGMTLVESARILGVRQPQVALLMRNRTRNF